MAIMKSCSSPKSKTVALVGRSRNGKSATANTILGRQQFKSRLSSSGVTKACEAASTLIDDGSTITIIDTRGLFQLSRAAASIGKQILRCITLAENGIHAILLVFSVRDRITKDEKVFSHLQTLFGSRIANYMIIVFTGGDELEENEETLEDYLTQECPQFLKVSASCFYILPEILELCDNRLVLFDNKTKDKLKQVEQVQKLLALVELVGKQNNGKPYIEELFNELQMETTLMKEIEMTLDEDITSPDQADGLEEDIPPLPDAPFIPDRPLTRSRARFLREKFNNYVESLLSLEPDQLCTGFSQLQLEQDKPPITAAPTSPYQDQWPMIHTQAGSTITSVLEP
ncbi:unnamed protein product [Arabidopsis halleri]